MADLFKTANADVLADLIFKAAARKVREEEEDKRKVSDCAGQAIDFRPSQAREGLINTVADILQVYKSTFSANVSGELVIPESLKMLPVYVLGMVKSPVLRVALGERVDRRAHLLAALLAMPWPRAVTFAYPKLYAPASPLPSKLALASLAEHGGVALLDTAFELLLLVARAADPNLLAHVFAVTSFDQIDPAQPLPLVDSPTSAQVPLLGFFCFFLLFRNALLGLAARDDFSDASPLRNVEQVDRGARGRSALARGIAVDGGGSKRMFLSLFFLGGVFLLLLHRTECSSRRCRLFRSSCDSCKDSRPSRNEIGFR